MDNWDEKRQSFIEWLARQEDFFNELLTKDKDGIVIGFDERGKLESLRKRSSSILQKLRSREFTVAVVGLEKAGKSTLGNALIKSEILPEYTERCTYTTTELRAGERNEAEITFYTDEEFNKIFQDMLISVGYNAQADFRTLTPEIFSRYWEAVSEDPSKRDLYERHNGKTDEDIITILKGSSTISELLGQPVKNFLWDNSQGNSEFQLYITGIKGYNSDGSAIRSAHPYAVKNVIIRSRELGSMSNIVLYDVPGFDSTTELHRKQTELMLREADAIILVTNVGDRPNINSPQLDMLRKVRDQDGIRLRDKTFVFGNKIDMAGNAARARDNASALRNEAERYQVASESRVISGSAKAYLEKLGLFSEDEKRRGKINAKERLEEWDMHDGMQELHGKIQDYYNNDRFEVLKKRAENTIAETVELLRQLLAKYSPDVISSFDTGGKYLLVLKGKAAEFDKAANDIVNKYQEQIINSRPFSTQLVIEIEKIFPMSDDFANIFTDVKRSVVTDIDGVTQLTAINSALRKKIHLLFMQNLVRETTELISNKQQEIRSELVKKFLSVMGMKEGSSYEDELTVSANKLFDELLIKNGEECRFNILIERFSLGLVETLINMPFAEYERLDKVCKTLPELFSLAMYYSMPDDENINNIYDSPNERLKFFARILAHENVEEKSRGINQSEILAVKSVLIEFFDNNSEALLKGAAFNIDSLPFDKWALMFTGADMKIDKMPKDLARQIESKIYSTNWQKLSRDERESAITELIMHYTHADSGQEKVPVLGEFLENLYKKASSLKAKTEGDMLRILDEDIAILRDITVKAVIRAIALERAFISVIVKNINFIRSGITYSGEDSKFDSWITQNVRKIMDSEFAAIDRYNMESQTRKSIVAAIQNILSNME
ncbi:MAG: dynamin family protein [Synergistaceae bacterium]|nr:dynamin family protein [Synergistaceae bacterium]